MGLTRVISKGYRHGTRDKQLGELGFSGSPPVSAEVFQEVPHQGKAGVFSGC